MPKLEKVFRNVRKAFHKYASSGFTLVELMVVVAIIALLAATALPQFRKYQARSRVSEAKLAMASIYTAEESYYGEYANYATCLNYMGYVPTGAVADRYYDVGFETVSTNHTGVRDGCATNATHSYLGAKMVDAAGLVTTADFSYASITGGWHAFTAEAIGIIDKDFTDDDNCSHWAITADKTIYEFRAGY
jgi:type IV pilus assembly protein PilA